MPKISVHLEADSPEEFRALLSALYATVPMTGVPAGQAARQSLPEIPLTPIQQSVRDGTFGVESMPVEAPAPVEAPVEAPAEKPVETRKRGRPAKAKPVEEAPVEPPVAAAPAPKIEVPKASGETRQDLLDVFAEYVQRYGANFGYTDISQLLQKHLGDGVRKASDVPEASLPVAIGAIRAAIGENPFNRRRDYA